VQLVGELLARDRFRLELLDLVRTLDLPDSWIGAGFVRNAVWDHLHGHPPSKPGGDVDVIWFDADNVDESADRKFENQLRGARPDIAWSVKNQARMHIRNGDEPYASAVDAMRFWPETATAIAARLVYDGLVEIAAPLGLDDLVELKLHPTTRFEIEKRDIFERRVRSKRWLQSYPMLTLTNPLGQA
jgi:uncharacterized protein